MPWTTLPNPPPPSFRWNQDYTPIVLDLRFGDDYGQTTIDGNAAQASSGTLNFNNLDEDEKDIIDGFFYGLGGVIPFLFQPPSESVPQTFICKKWNVDMINGHVYNITATIERRFDVADS